MCQKKGIYTKKKEEAATSLFPIILDALQKKGIYMIILDSKKNNSFCEKSERNFSENIKKYKNTLNYGYITCPNCHSSNVIKWGSYERNVIYFNEQGKIISEVMVLQRIRCKSCGTTHALLPIGIIPYKQFAEEVVSQVLLEVSVRRIEEVSLKYYISEEVITRWKKQFRKKHESRLAVLIGKRSIKEILQDFIKKEENKREYIKRNKMVFMQIKLGCLGLGPS